MPLNPVKQHKHVQYETLKPRRITPNVVQLLIEQQRTAHSHLSPEQLDRHFPLDNEGLLGAYGFYSTAAKQGSLVIARDTVRPDSYIGQAIVRPDANSGGWRKSTKDQRLDTVAVDPNYRGKGIGSGLLTLAYGNSYDAKPPAVASIPVYSGVEAVPFLTKRGFVIVDTPPESNKPERIHLRAEHVGTVVLLASETAYISQ